MRAAVCNSYGPPEIVRVREIPSPPIGPSTVRVHVRAAAVNFPDVLVVANEYQVQIPLPFVPGSEFAGVVTEVGDDVADLRVGDRVFGTTMVGAFAEEAVVRASSLTRTPDGVGDLHAAAFGVAHRTAHHALRSFAVLRPGEELIVLGAGGGVGLAAVQLGVVLGATVTAVASSDEKLAIAESFGATRLINHRAGDFRQALRVALPNGADAVIDPVGGDIAEPALRSLHWGGRFVVVGFAAGIPRIPLNLVLLKGVHILGFQMRDFGIHAPEDMQRDESELMGLLTGKRAFPHIGATFTLDDAGVALRYVADGRAIGKVALDVSVAS
jgi:NADPH:quinone reductase